MSATSAKAKDTNTVDDAPGANADQHESAGAEPADTAVAAQSHASPESKLTPEEEAAVDSFISRFTTYRQEVRAVEPRKTKPARKAEAASHVAAPPPPPPPIDDAAVAVGEIARAIAAGVATGLRQTTPPEPSQDRQKAEKPEQADWLDDEDKETIRVLERMGKSKEEYAGLAERYTQSLKRALEYREKWEKEHPGEEFDPDSEEHAEFFAQNDVDWDEADYAAALAEIKAEKIAEKAVEKAHEEVRKVRREIAEKEAQPIIKQIQTAASRQFFKIVGDNYDVLGKDGEVDAAKLKKVWDEDPAAAEIVYAAADAAERASAELERLTRGIVEYDKGNPLHVALASVIQEQEQSLLAAPPSETVKDGKRFLPAVEFEALPESERAKFWRLTPEDIRRLIVEDFAQRAKRGLQEHEARLMRIASKRGWIQSEAARAAEEARIAEMSKPAALRRAPEGSIPPPIPSPVGLRERTAEGQEPGILDRWFGRA